MTESELLLASETISGIGGWSLCEKASLQWTAQTFRLHGLDPTAPQPSLEQAVQLIDAGDRGRFQACIDEARATGRGGPVELRVRRADGTCARLRGLARTVPTTTGASVLAGTWQALEPTGSDAESTAQGAPALSLMSPLLGSEFVSSIDGVGLFEVELEGGSGSWSAGMLEIHGLPRDSLAPSRADWCQRFLHSDDRARVELAAAQTLALDQSCEIDCRVRRASDGAWRWLHVRASRSRQRAGRAVGIAFDITERKQAEERARDAFHALDVSATQVGFGFGYRDVLSDVGEWSAQLKMMFGLAPDAPTPTRAQMIERVDEADRARVARELLVRPVAGQLREFEYGVVTPQGAQRRLMTRAVARADGEGRPWRYYFVAVDMTETRARDRRVADLLGRLQLATEGSGIGTWERDPDAVRPVWDDTTLSFFGLPPGSAAPDAAEYMAMVHPDDRERVAREWNSRRLPGEVFDYQMRVLLAGQQLRWLTVRGRVLGDARGQSPRRIGICYDTTERHIAEAALQAKEVAERANAAKTEFLSRMSHELRTPLNAVLGFAQLLLLDPAEPLRETQHTRVNHIQTAGWHLLALINDVLDLARIESRQALLRPERVGLAEVVDECIAMNAAVASQRGIAIHSMPRGGAPVFVWADRTRIKQVLLNLLSNAIKYNREGGWVRVAASAEPSGGMRVLVSDSGMGLNADQLAHLFEPFNRLGREQGGIEGTGIGLALSKLIAEQMGGQLEAVSEAGVGSEFCLTLPPEPG